MGLRAGGPRSLELKGPRAQEPPKSRRPKAEGPKSLELKGPRPKSRPKSRGPSLKPLETA
jgi:hypothetical protein